MFRGHLFYLKSEVNFFVWLVRGGHLFTFDQGGGIFVVTCFPVSKYTFLFFILWGFMFFIFFNLKIQRGYVMGGRQRNLAFDRGYFLPMENDYLPGCKFVDFDYYKRMGQKYTSIHDGVLLL